MVTYNSVRAVGDKLVDGSDTRARARKVDWFWNYEVSAYSTAKLKRIVNPALFRFRLI